MEIADPQAANHPPLPRRARTVDAPLNATEEAVSQAYCIHGTAVAVAKALGLHRTTVSNILSAPNVHARVREIFESRFTQENINGQRVVQELARIAFSDIRDCFDIHGNLLPPHMMSADAAAAIASVDTEVVIRGKGDDAEPVIIKKIRRADKLGALNTLARHFKVVGNDDDGVNNLANALADKLKAARRRAQGKVVDEVIEDAVEVTADALTIEEPAMLPVDQGDGNEDLW
jgi:phage terminase small subunit